MNQNKLYWYALYTIFLCSYIPVYADKKINYNNIIIVLNGTSSAGKTTLSNALKKIDPSYEIARIDDYTRKHMYLWWNTKAHNFYQEVYDLALTGKNIIVDTVLYHKNMRAYDKQLQTGCTKIIKILVYCPLDCIIAHVLKRNQSGNAFEHRNINQAFKSFLSLYTLEKHGHKDIIESCNSSTMKAALEKALQVMHNRSSKHVKRQEKTNKLLTCQFDLEKPHQINIAPQHSWDLLVNTAHKTPEELAQQILDFVAKYK